MRSTEWNLNGLNTGSLNGGSATLASRGVMGGVSDAELGSRLVTQAVGESQQRAELDPRMKAAVTQFATKLTSEISSKGFLGALQSNYSQEWSQLTALNQQIAATNRDVNENYQERTSLIVANGALDDAEKARRLQMEEEARQVRLAQLAEMERIRREREENLRLLHQVTASHRAFCMSSQVQMDAQRRMHGGKDGRGAYADVNATLPEDLKHWLDRKVRQDFWGVISSEQSVVSSQLVQAEETDPVAAVNASSANGGVAPQSGQPPQKQVLEMVLRDKATQLYTTRRLNPGQTRGSDVAARQVSAVSIMASPTQATTGNVAFGGGAEVASAGEGPSYFGQSQNAPTGQRLLFPGERVQAAFA